MCLPTLQCLSPHPTPHSHLPLIQLPGIKRKGLGSSSTANTSVQLDLLVFFFIIVISYRSVGSCQINAAG